MVNNSDEEARQELVQAQFNLTKTNNSEHFINNNADSEKIIAANTYCDANPQKLTSIKHTSDLSKEIPNYSSCEKLATAAADSVISSDLSTETFSESYISSTGTGNSTLDARTESSSDYRLRALSNKPITFSKATSNYRKTNHPLTSININDTTAQPESSINANEKRDSAAALHLKTQIDPNHSVPFEGLETYTEQLLSALEVNPWIQAPALPGNLNISSELVNETLNYFVNCGQRLTQMTKTYDDIDAVIKLLQEKEIDLELAARIGQDLLRQNSKLKTSILSLEDELETRKEQLQQLKHELASKTSLLETFIEEEEHTSNTLSTNTTNTVKGNNFLTFNTNDDDDSSSQNGFLSLNYYGQKLPTPSVEPFSSLQHELIADFQQDKDRKATPTDDSNPSTTNCCQSNDANQRLVETVTIQLVESNRRLCELQDELAFKNEQNRIQEGKITKLLEQLQQSDRRLCEIGAENESLARSIRESLDHQKELSEELKICKKNFGDLLKVFVELQQESRFYRNQQLYLNQNSSFLPTTRDSNAEVIRFEEALLGDHDGQVLSSSLLSEVQDSLRARDENGSLDEISDGRDSGAPTTARSSATPTASCTANTDSEDASLGYESEGSAQKHLARYLNARAINASPARHGNHSGNSKRSNKRHQQSTPKLQTAFMSCSTETDIEQPSTLKAVAVASANSSTSVNDESSKTQTDTSAASIICRTLNASLLRSFPNGLLTNKVQLIKRIEGSRHLNKWKKLASPDLNAIVQTKANQCNISQTISNAKPLVNDEVD